MTTSVTTHTCSQVMVNGKGQAEMCMSRAQLEEVSSFQYVGATLSKDGSCTPGILIRITTGTGTMARLHRIWHSSRLHQNNIKSHKPTRSLPKPLLLLHRPSPYLVKPVFCLHEHLLCVSRAVLFVQKSVEQGHV